jgi:hypothetical protein
VLLLELCVGKQVISSHKTEKQSSKSARVICFPTRILSKNSDLLFIFLWNWAVGMQSTGKFPLFSCEPKRGKEKNPKEPKSYKIPLQFPQSKGALNVVILATVTSHLLLTVTDHYSSTVACCCPSDPVRRQWMSATLAQVPNLSNAPDPFRAPRPRLLTCLDHGRGAAVSQ